MQTKHLCVWTKCTVEATFDQFKPSSKTFYWLFQGGASFVDLLCFSVLCLLCLCARLFICALCSPAGKGLTFGSRLWCLTMSLSLSHWYPVSRVVLDCIDSWSLHDYLLSFACYQTVKQFGSRSDSMFSMVWSSSNWHKKDKLADKWAKRVSIPLNQILNIMYEDCPRKS